MAIVGAPVPPPTLQTELDKLKNQLDEIQALTDAIDIDIRPGLGLPHFVQQRINRTAERVGKRIDVKMTEFGKDALELAKRVFQLDVEEAAEMYEWVDAHTASDADVKDLWLIYNALEWAIEHGQ